MRILAHPWLYFVFSGILIIPGIVFLALFGLRFGIDFTGGTLLELEFEKGVTSQGIETIIEQEGVEVHSVQISQPSLTRSGNKTALIRTKLIDRNQEQTMVRKLGETLGQVRELRFETVGPTIGKELRVNALKALGLTSLAIVVYIAWAFRRVPKPAVSWRFAFCTIAALLHDIFVLIGAMAILGHYFHAEVDSLFVTALLTVIGFSVHDTIVVFDRIRENLRKHAGHAFREIVDASIVQTLGRSLATSLTVIFVLTALLLFGGYSIRWFVVALLIGITSGTYSSIFNAAPLLVIWEEWTRKTRLAVHTT